MAYKGFFKTKNPQKYLGKNPNAVKFDSLWEMRFMEYCDHTESVITWAREPFAIPYQNPATGKTHRYMVDFYIQLQTKENEIKEYLVEIKPYKQTREPKIKLTEKTKKPTRSFIKESITYQINKAKWEEAKKFCKTKGWEFIILTEKNARFT